MLLFHKKIDKIQEYFFYFVIYVGYIVLVLSLLGINRFHHKYLDDLNYYFNVYISIFLLLRFNPFRQNVMFSALDRHIAFSAGWFVFTNTLIKQYANQIQAFFPPSYSITDIVL
jgi:hypothetical protein